MSDDHIVVNNIPVDIDIKDELTIQDVSSDMDKVAALMGFWGGVWAAAEEEKVNVDAFYRQWRATVGEEIMRQEPKLAVQKIQQRIECDQQFIILKAAIAKAVKNVTIAKTHYESFRTKANILQSKGAMYRAEYDATNMKTRQVSNEDKVQKMKNDIKKTQNKE